MSLSSGMCYSLLLEFNLKYELGTKSSCTYIQEYYVCRTILCLYLWKGMRAFCPNHAQLLLVGVQYLLSTWCDWHCCPHIWYLHVPALYLAIVHPTPRPSSIADEFAQSPSFLVCIDDQCNSKPVVPDTAAFARQHYFIIFSKSTCKSHYHYYSFQMHQLGTIKNHTIL